MSNVHICGEPPQLSLILQWVDLWCGQDFNWSYIPEVSATGEFSSHTRHTHKVVIYLITHR